MQSINKLLRSFWLVASSVPALLILAALLGLIGFSWRLDLELWDHLRSYVLGDVLWNTFSLLVLVALLSSLIGVGLALLVAFVRFPGKKWMEMAFLLPLAFPAYVFAFIWIGFFEYSGGFQSFLRESFGFVLPFQHIRGRLGIAVVLSVALYPYIYLLVKDALTSLGSRYFEVASLLGTSKVKFVRRVAFPLCLPWFFAGLSLVALECLADFGVAVAFNYDTLTVLVFQVWTDYFSLPTASQLSLLHLGGIFFVSVIFYRARKNTRVEVRDHGSSCALEWVPSQGVQILILLAAVGFLLLTFFLPLLQLFTWSVSEIKRGLDDRFIGWLWHTLLVGGLCAILICSFSLILSTAQRLTRFQVYLDLASRLGSLGYAFPGTVLAVATLVFFTGIFGPLSQISGALFFLMIAALSARYFAVGFRPISSRFERIPKNIDLAAQSLGASLGRILRRVHYPLVRSSVVGASLFIFMDVVKEMPIQVMMRPYGWDTLSIRIYQFTTEAQWEQAALPALVLVFVSIGPALWLARGVKKNELHRSK